MHLEILKNKKEDKIMVKKVFERIWRTFMIVFNTFMNLMFVTVTVVALFQGNSTWDNNEQVFTCLIMVLLINLIDFITRKHFKNY